jgi:hypothetical protein
MSCWDRYRLSTPVVFSTVFGWVPFRRRTPIELWSVCLIAKHESGLKMYNVRSHTTHLIALLESPLLFMHLYRHKH